MKAGRPEVQWSEPTELLARLRSSLRLSEVRSAVVTIDMHRGHLDPTVATSPLPAELADRVVTRARAFLEFARSRKIPIIHAILTRRQVEAGMNPFKKHVLSLQESLLPGQRQDILGHNLEGSRGTELMPQLGSGPGDFLISNKKTYSIFLYTDLEYLLKALNVDTLILMGVNTNTCVLASAFEATCRLYRVVVLNDCSASGYGEDLHEAALQIVKRCIGWVFSSEEFMQKWDADVTAGEAVHRA